MVVERGYNLSTIASIDIVMFFENYAETTRKYHAEKKPGMRTYDISTH